MHQSAPNLYKIYAKAEDIRCIVVREDQDRNEHDASAMIDLREIDVLKVHQLQYTKPSLKQWQQEKDQYALLMQWEAMF